MKLTKPRAVCVGPSGAAGLGTFAPGSPHEIADEHYDNQDKLFYNILRKVVREAWDAVTSKQLDEILNIIHARCEAVIASDEKHCLLETLDKMSIGDVRLGIVECHVLTADTPDTI